MKISTKFGDNGQTSLATGERLWKNDLRIETIGEIDELISNLGFAKSIACIFVKEKIERIQKALFEILTEIASNPEKKRRIKDFEFEWIDFEIEELEQKVSLSSFVLPGATSTGAYLDICRTVARRVERRLVALGRIESVPSKVLVFINRLSDFLFLLARYVEKNAVLEK